MCGIFGIASDKSFSIRRELLEGLKRLEYRGYDSSGFATNEGIFKKKKGYIQTLIDSTDDVKATTAISHSRWSTHGKPTDNNAHPHFNKDKTIFAVHNGILENFQDMKEQLIKKGHEFMTETDSEVIPHYFDYWLNERKKDIKEVMKKFISDAKGTFAILLIIKGDDNIYAMKRDSPLVMGLCEGKNLLASDIYAFSGNTDKAIFFGDDEYGIISSRKHYFFDKDGNEIKKKVTSFEWERDEETKEHYDHFMIKEVKEQPKAASRLVQSLSMLQRPKLIKLVRMIRKAKRVVFIAAGTSYHATLTGVVLLKKQGVEAHTIIASEFDNFLMADKDTLIVAVTQSGETMDVVKVLKKSGSIGCKVASIVNVPHSTVQRLSDVSIEIMAGQEICVAATKSFTNQIITMLAIADELGYQIRLGSIPKKIQNAIDKNESKVKNLAKDLMKKKDIFVLGRGLSYPVAREIALKLKEISYIHAEGMMGGELKHGTIALIEKGTPVISLIPNHNEEMISNTKEVEARGARTIIISNSEDENLRPDFIVPKSCDAEFSIYACIVGHLLSYYIAKENNLPIDKPRNLAKSCTVL